jgi:hypothetical protein
MATQDRAGVGRVLAELRRLSPQRLDGLLVSTALGRPAFVKAVAAAADRGLLRLDGVHVHLSDRGRGQSA